MTRIKGNAHAGHRRLLNWVDGPEIVREATTIGRATDDEVLQIMADIDTARAHAESVLEYIKTLRPEAILPIATTVEKPDIEPESETNAENGT